MNFNAKSDQPHAGEVLDYVSRNSKWLQPALATFIAVASQRMLAIVDPTLQNSFLPPWFVPAAAVLGFFGVGLGASMTETLSAAIVRYLGFAASVGLFLATVFR